MAPSNIPIATLFLSLFAAASAYPAADNASIADPPFSASPTPAPDPTFTSTAEPPFSTSLAPAEPPLSTSSAPVPARTPIAEAPFSASPATALTFIAEPPFSASSAPAPGSAFDQMLFTTTGALEGYEVAPRDVQAMDSRYLAAHMSAAANKVEVFVATEVERKLGDPATAEYEKECLAICKEVYASAAESMKRGVESVGAGDFVKATFDVSAFNIDVDTCSDCVGTDFDKFDVWAKAVAGDCLDRIVKHTNRIH